MKWNIDLKNKAPKTGELVLRYNPELNTIRIVKWNENLKHWNEENGQWVNVKECDLWFKIPKLYEE